MAEFVSRAGAKLEHALEVFGVDVKGLVCADLGSNTGGFVDCLLQRGAAKVYAIERGYGVLDWKLRNDPRVVVMERTNAMHVQLSEKVGFISIDVSWTKQKHILPAVPRLLANGGQVVSLLKPHYEADANLLKKGVLPEERVQEVVVAVIADIHAAGFDVLKTTPSPIRGGKGNVEMLGLLRRVDE
jgi:23S rRNA (cytidine1920-2'-O)/16S rRNA (cytidine1409-2'-O)-methyltransferase